MTPVLRMATVGVLRNLNVRFEDGYTRTWEDDWKDQSVLMTGELPVVFSNRNQVIADSCSRPAPWVGRVGRDTETARGLPRSRNLCAWDRAPSDSYLAAIITISTTQTLSAGNPSRYDSFALVTRRPGGRSDRFRFTGIG